MASRHPEPRDPADISRRVMLTGEQRDWIRAAAAALEDHADHDVDPLAMLEAASELRRVVGEWDGARDSRSADTGEPRLREALRQIADAESGIWGWIARDALDDRQATGNADGGARRHGTLATRDDAIAAGGQCGRARR
jgi:hypothetical protein